MARREMRLKPITEDFVRRMAYILGDCSAAAKAIADYERRQNQEPYKLGFYLSDDNAIVVGPLATIEP